MGTIDFLQCSWNECKFCRMEEWCCSALIHILSWEVRFRVIYITFQTAKCQMTPGETILLYMRFLKIYTFLLSSILALDGDTYFINLNTFLHTHHNWKVLPLFM